MTRRDLEAVVLLLVGGALLKSGLDGGYVAYLRVGMRPFLLATGAVLAVVALLELARVVEHERERERDHGHGGGSRVGWLLAAPVLALLLLAPPPLGSEAAARSGTALGSAPAGSD